MNRRNNTSGPARSAGAALFAEAVARHQAGELAAAERLYRQILSIAPGHADSLHLLGLANAQSGRPEAGARFIERAVSIRPDFAQAHYNLGNVRRRLGRLEDAVDAYRQAARLQPDSATTLVNLGVTLRDLGRMDEAIDAYRRAIATAPADVPAHYNLGVALQAAGRLDEAVASYRRAVEIAPGHADAWANLGSALMTLGRSAEAAAACRERLKLEPDDAGAHAALAAALLDLGRFQASVEASLRAARLAPDDVDVLNLLGSALRECGRADEAAAAYQRAANIAPGDATAWVNLAIIRQESADTVGAMDAVNRALAVDPRSAAAWSVRGGLKTFIAGDADVAAMTDVLRAMPPGAPSDDRINIEFTLGKAYMDIGEPVRAFAHLDAANRLKRSRFTYSVREDEEQFAEIARGFEAGRLATSPGAGCPTDRPVFIVGMPRSGTTLVEQVLSSHPGVHGAGELTLLEDLLIERLGQPLAPTARARRMAEMTTDDLRAIGAAYADRLGALAPGSPRVTDKMPANFRLAGLIRLALPNARIVHCRRDAVDTCLSCYTRNFSKGQPWTYDQGELGAYYLAYERLMAHWRALLPADRFIEVAYERVVDDLEGEARRLIGFCGLQWDDACLSFHRNRRQVRTASVNQVRQPLYRSSVARWRAYEAQLGPLLKALGQAAAPPP